MDSYRTLQSARPSSFKGQGIIFFFRNSMWGQPFNISLNFDIVEAAPEGVVGHKTYSNTKRYANQLLLSRRIALLNQLDRRP